MRPIASRKAAAAVLLAASLLALSQHASAAVTYVLTNSNTESSWPDGQPYAFVTLTQNGSNVDVNVDANDAAFTIIPANYGIQHFAFNDASGTLAMADITGLPLEWSSEVPPNGNSDGFGAFDAEVGTTGQSRADPLTFTVLNATIADFQQGSSNGIWFAVHITDIDGGLVTSAWFGGGNGLVPPAEVPVPATIWLFGSGLLGLVGIARRRKV